MKMGVEKKLLRCRAIEHRQTDLRALATEKLDPSLVDVLRAATNGGCALGSARFRKEIKEAAPRRASPLPPGPKRQSASDAPR